MRYIILLLILLIPIICAETTFSDNPNNVLIMAGSATGEAIEETEEITINRGGGRGCRYEWDCTNWSKCSLRGKQTRNCINTGTCLSAYNAPETSQDCIYTVLPKEEKIGEIILEKVVDKNKIFFCSAAILAVLSIIFYLKKDYFAKLIKR
jgi:hypothetical protein